MKSRKPAVDPEIVSQRRTSAAETGFEKPNGAANSVFDVARPPAKPRRERVTAPAFDPKAIAIKKGVPIPPVHTGTNAGQAARYQALLERMKPGDSVELLPIVARGLASYAKKAKVKVTLRKVNADLIAVWRL